MLKSSIFLLKAMKTILVGLGQAAVRERVRNNISDVDRERVNKFRRDSAAFSSSLINKYTHQKKVLELLSQGLVTDEFAGATLATIAKADEVPECQRLVDECGQVETILHKAGEFTLWRFIKEHKWAFVVLLLGVVLVAVPGAQFAFLIPQGMEIALATVGGLGVGTATAAATALSISHKSEKQASIETYEAVKARLRSIQDVLQELQGLLLDHDSVLNAAQDRGNRVKELLAQLLHTCNDILKHAKELQTAVSHIEEIPEPEGCILS